MGVFSRTTHKAPEEMQVKLDLSGEILRHTLEGLITACEERGGIERYTYALQLRSDMFKESFSFKNPVAPDEETLQRLCSFMPTVRRRIAPYIEDKQKNQLLKDALLALLDGAEDTANTDDRIESFCKVFPKDKKHRWVRDFAGEILHGTDPERYPLMCRWIWDTKSNTGILREVWFSDNIDHKIIDVADTYQTFITLRQELSQYLSDNGIYRDMLQHVDLLQAQLYSNYICEHGGTYIRADFSNPEDPTMHIRRLLGLDGVSAKGRSKLKTIEGQSVVFDTLNVLN
jgi:hypothetical protein